MNRILNIMDVHYEKVKNLNKYIAHNADEEAELEKKPRKQSQLNFNYWQGNRVWPRENI